MRKCKKQNCEFEKKNGNCHFLGEDGLPVQCVGLWAENKYYFIERYLNATCEVRRKFSSKSNAVYIDLFPGPGRCIIREEKREINNGALIAMSREEAPFNEYVFVDVDEENCDALSKRIPAGLKYSHNCGNSNDVVFGIVEKLEEKPYRYHFAFLDPFGPDNLKFTTIKELAKLKRMDLLIHFPLGSIKRNLPKWIGKENTILDEFLGTDEWRKDIDVSNESGVVEKLIKTLEKQLITIGYPQEGLRMAASDTSISSSMSAVPIKNSKDVSLYVLVLAAKHKLAQDIWNSIIRIGPNGQRELF